MNEAAKTGLNFGLTSGVITTLGLIVGLHSGTNSTLAVIGGIITIAIADALSDALGIHISKEAEANTSNKEVWQATFMTLITKMVMAMTFVIPVLVLKLDQAIIAAIVWAFLVLTILSYFLARSQNDKPHKVILEHLAIAVFVVVTTHYVGDWVAVTFV